MKQTVIFLDRDGTLICDKKCHFGSQMNWRSLITILPHVKQGIKSLRKIPNVKIYLVTNQSGVAITNYPLLTYKRAKEVTEFVLRKIGVKIDGYKVCRHVSPTYVREHPEFTFNKKLLGNFHCMKPNPGMMEEIFKNDKLAKKDFNIYMIGDRASDMKAVLKMNGFGILVPYGNEKEEIAKVEKLRSRKIYIAKDFRDVVRFILRRELKV